MIVLVDTNDSRAVRNKDNILALYELMINQKRSEEATAKFCSPDYIQHNPILADGAVGDYVFAHVNFLNLLTDDPENTGIAGVDIYKMDAGGIVVEHWDTLQLVGDPTNSAPWAGQDIPRANPHGMF